MTTIPNLNPIPAVTGDDYLISHDITTNRSGRVSAAVLKDYIASQIISDQDITSADIPYESITVEDQLDKTVEVVPSFSALSATSGTVGQQVSVSGSQGGVFDVVSPSGLSTNTGTIVVNGGIAFRRQYVYLTVKMFGAKCDNGVTDDTAAIQAAIDFACPLVGAGFAVGLYLNPGGCKVTSTLNLTNSRTGGTKNRDGFKFFGDGFGSNLIGETGDEHAVIEVTGSQWLILEDITIFSGTTNKSTIGIYQGVSSTLPQTQNQVFNRVKVMLHDDPAANGGVGTIGLWNYGAEENTYDAIYIMANIPAIFTTQNSLFGGYQNSYQSLSSSHSLGVTALTGECFMVSLGRRQPPLILQGVNSFSAPCLYLSNSGNSGTNDDAIAVYANCVGVSINGTIEEVGTIHVYDTIKGSDFRFVFGFIANSSAPILKLERGGAGVITNSQFNITNNAVASQTRNLFSLTPAAITEQVSCYVEDSSFKTNLPVGYTGLQENLLWNPKTNNVHISGESWTYDIKDFKHIIGLNQFSLGTTGTTTKICGIRMPTVVANNSALGLSVEVSGMVGTTPYGDSARTTGFYRGVSCLSTSQNGAITYGTAVDSLSSVASANPGGNALTAVALSLSADTNPLNAAIKLTPTITGANGSTCTFTGKIEMLWSGHTACAPALVRAGNTTP